MSAPYLAFAVRSDSPDSCRPDRSDRGEARGSPDHAPRRTPRVHDAGRVLADPHVLGSHPEARRSPALDQARVRACIAVEANRRRRAPRSAAPGRGPLPLRRGLLPELDADPAQPAPDVAIDGRSPERDLLVERPLDRVEDERLGLRAAEAAVRADELLERGDLAELGVVLAEQQQVRRVDHLVLALEAHDRVRPEQGRRVLALDPVLVEVARPVRPEDDRAVRLRADQQQPDARMGRDRGDEARMELLELLDRQAVIVAGEPDEPEIARPDDRDRRLRRRRPVRPAARRRRGRRRRRSSCS